MKIFSIIFVSLLVAALSPRTGYCVTSAPGTSPAGTALPSGAAATEQAAEALLAPVVASAPSAPSAPSASAAPASQGGASPRDGFFTGFYDVGSAANGIGFSRHNLGRYGGNVRTETTFDICVYCHTPHRPSDKGGPIWEGGAAASRNFTAYGTSLEGTKISTVGLGSPSLACLSCHDGTAAPDNVARSPGKKREPQKKTPGQWGFLVDETKMDQTLVSTRLLLGPLLTDDHPVNVLFRGGQYASLRKKSTIISRINLVAGLRTPTERIPNLWSIKGFISDTATIGDLLRDGRIECSSCHDPHFNNKSWREARKTFKNWDDMDGLFLRRVGGNFSSGVCRTCHGK